MVKKVVDVYNRAFEINTADDVSVDSETNNNSDVEVSETIHDDDDVDDDAGTSAVYTPAIVKQSKEKSTVAATTTTSTATSDAACIESSNDTSLQDDVHEIKSSASSPVAMPKRDKRRVRSTNTAVDNVNPDDSLLQSIFKLLPNRNSSQEESEKSLLIGVGLGLGAAMTNNTSNILPDTMVFRAVGASKPSTRYLLTRLYQQVPINLLVYSLNSSIQAAASSTKSSVISSNSTDVPTEPLPESIHASTAYHYLKRIETSGLGASNVLSSYLTLPSSIINSDTKVLMQVSDATSNTNQLKGIIEESILNLVAKKKRVTALNLANTAIDSTEQVLGQVFSTDENPENTLKSLLLEDNMEYIGVTNSKSLVTLDSASLSRFNRLVALDLSHNSITSITNTLVIPSLQYLDLSNNNLKTLDYLQQLISLKHLNVSNNKLTTLASSVYMLVPLSHNLTSFDMRHNPVCVSYKAQYVGETLRVLHKLVSFDNVVINNYKNNVKHKVENEFEMRLKRELKHRDLHKTVPPTAAATGTYSLNYSLTYSLTHLLTRLLTHSPTYSPTYSPTHSPIHSPTHSLTYSLTHLLTHSPTHSLTYSLTHLLTHLQ